MRMTKRCSDPTADICGHFEALPLRSTRSGGWMHHGKGVHAKRMRHSLLNAHSHASGAHFQARVVRGAAEHRGRNITPVRL